MASSHMDCSVADGHSSETTKKSSAYSLSHVFHNIGLDNAKQQSRKRRRAASTGSSATSASLPSVPPAATTTVTPQQQQQQQQSSVSVAAPPVCSLSLSLSVGPPDQQGQHQQQLSVVCTPAHHRKPSSTPPASPKKPAARPRSQLATPMTPNAPQSPTEWPSRALFTDDDYEADADAASQHDLSQQQHEQQVDAAPTAAISDQQHDQQVAIGYSLLKDAVTSGAFSAHSEEYTKYSRLRGCIVCVEGIISAGKTTLGTRMAKYLNDIGVRAEFYQEFVEETLLHLFYSDPQKYAFAFQMFMLRSCMANLTLAEQKSRADGTVCIIDRSIWGNAVFAAMQREMGNISDQEWAVYLRVMKTKAPCMADFVVYLDCNPASSLERIHNRGRQSESTVPLEYLQNLERHYTTEMLLHMREATANVVPVQWDRYGSVPSVLDALVSGTRYRVAGDPAAVYDRDRAFRARVMSRLARDAFVDLDQPL